MPPAEDLETELLRQLDGSNEHDLSTFPHMSVQLWEVSRDDLISREWTTQHWDRLWRQHDAENAERISQQLVEGAGVHEQVASHLGRELRPPWLLLKWRDIRFVKNTGTTQVMKPQALVIWGSRAQIFTGGGKAGSLRLSTHAFNLTFLDITGKKLTQDSAGQSVPAVEVLPLTTAAAKKSRAKPRQTSSGTTSTGGRNSASAQADAVLLTAAASKSKKQGGSKKKNSGITAMSSVEPAAAAAAAVSVQSGTGTGRRQNKRRRHTRGNDSDSDAYENSEGEANAEASESNRRTERSRATVSYRGLDEIGEREPDEDIDPDLDDDPEDSDDLYEIESIVREQKEAGIDWYLVKWKDCPVNDAWNSPDWKTREQLETDCPNLLAEFDICRENTPLSVVANEGQQGAPAAKKSKKQKR